MEPYVFVYERDAEILTLIQNGGDMYFYLGLILMKNMVIR